MPGQAVVRPLLFAAAVAQLAIGGPRGRLAHRVARALRPKLGADHHVLVSYRPRNDRADRVPLIVVGPGTVTVVELRDDAGTAICDHDAWQLSRHGERALPVEPSPSKRARWHAARVASDVADTGLTGTRVEAVVLFTRARLSDTSTSPVAVAAGVDGLAQHIARGVPAPRSAERARALAAALAGREHA